MKIVVVGSTGTIGKAVVAALAERHEVIGASRRGRVQVDIDSPQSIKQFYAHLGKVDAIVSCAGNAAFKPLAAMADEELAFGIKSKLTGQVNLVRYGMDNLTDNGSFTLTSGVLAENPMPGGSAISMVNAGVQAFARAAALELPRGLRVNVVSPGWVTDTLKMLGMDPSHGQEPASVAKAYVALVEGKQNGETLLSTTFTVVIAPADRAP